MAALAVLMKGEGHEVDGCDAHPSRRTGWLESLGIPVAPGHAAEHAERADMVIATPAVDSENPEIAAARGKLRWRGEILAEIVSSRDSIAVCGSHGKTTTATFTAKLLAALGEDVAWAIGGETGDMPVAKCAAGPLVVEADESDGTLALYCAKLLVVTNCDYDHPDYFKTREEYLACYEAARRNSLDVIEAEALSLEGWEFPVVGEHNRRNARAAVEVALRRGHSREAIEKALPRALAQLPDRRFERLADGVWTDYAHHPAEMRCAIGMARAASKGKLRVIFQPHRYSRTKALLGDFAGAFDGADEVIICPVYGAFERPLEGGEACDLYAACRAREGAPWRVYLARSCAEAARHARLEARMGDATLFLGAGDIYSTAQECAGAIAAAANARAAGAAGDGAGVELARLSTFLTGGRSLGGGKCRIIGAGSNTWISDLTTDEEFIRAQGLAARPGASLGIPWMAGVPGTIGGWVKMNAGAFGHSISELVRRVKADGRWLEKTECNFGYRHSAIPGLIEEVEFDEAALAALRRDGDAGETKACLERRPHFPPRTCGSVFRNPPGEYAGRLLEAAGAKGLRVGGAYVWEGHANIIAAGDGANSSDILALAEICRRKVLERFDIRLEYEIAGIEE